MASNITPIPASYKDPAGFVYRHDGTIYRQINRRAKPDYDQLMSSGLYEELIVREQMMSHKEVSLAKKATADAYKIIQPDQIPFISYPYEWSFSQLKDAALLTLAIQSAALEHGLSLKDASAYNVQFIQNKPVFIDTLSFEKYPEGKPWVAYRQFCQHFLAPLALAAYVDIRFLLLQKQYLDGFPLDLASKLLPRRTVFNLGLSMHLHAHAKSQAHFADKKTAQVKSASILIHALKGIISHLHSTVKGLKLSKSDTEWGEYYTFTNYSDESFDYKKKLISQFVSEIKPSVVLDLGANTGEFSRAAVKNAQLVVSTDYDLLAVEKNYLQVKANNETKILPLVLDVTNPSSSHGWAGTEREDFFSRGKFDMILALALIHHLVITFNLPLSSVAQFLSQQAPYLIIELVPKNDSQVKKLLQNREDIFTDYDEAGFEAAFGKYFKTLQKEAVKGSQRTLYLLKRI
ncbi:hypothetical protein A3F34_01235 [Candidatus Roizmanbacteria bacterium RIFCSPHIGHO2_12_FULL_44_10]|uniref:SAM-dependent methyltransferase n=1 Tax=Candidatus Roizmanbacteria bacterium RIFCSPHIGHO2_12_FULL_44_10 TaxID=1802054 RepID=A0A1F7I5C4_9BACT|nr:MAG: hypothetical protein A3F34_01235 [Candidatus Roizmanbacteria bacterium RIFCSPHIGHO2_12_FULL_44_10]